MGVRVIETDPDAYDVEDCAPACCTYVTTTTTTAPSSSSSSSTTTTTTTTTNIPRTPEMPIGGNAHRGSKDLVGNFKEFRIEHNKCDLRIVGNGNRIRIRSNDGNLQIIGNGTRVKIISNAGRIKYTGNDGRISLGEGSTQQVVEYIGCNGLLKVGQNNDNNSDNNNKSKQPATCFTVIDDITKSPCAAAATVTLTKSKSASYDGMGDYKNAHWQQFNELFKRRSASADSSVPSLKENNYQHNKNNKKRNNGSANGNPGGRDRQCFHINNNVNIVNSRGDIVIRNAVNISL